MCKFPAKWQKADRVAPTATVCGLTLTGSKTLLGSWHAIRQIALDTP